MYMRGIKYKILGAFERENTEQDEQLIGWA